MLVTKVHYLLHKNLSKMKTNTRWLHFSPKSFAHNFGHFVLFHINTAQKYNGHKFRSFGTKTLKSYKQTHDDLFLHPKNMYIIFGHFIVVSHEYG